MSLRNDLSKVVASDSRYSIHAYTFVFEALDHAQKLKRRGRTRSKSSATTSRSRHVTGRELCEGARDLALRQYGRLALTVLNRWGIRATADLGSIVYNLIESGDLSRTPNDSREDFNDVFDFESEFRSDFVLGLDHVDKDREGA